MTANDVQTRDDLRRAPYIGTAAEYASYFRAFPLNAEAHAMVKEHARFGVLTMGQIAGAAGWSSFRAGNRSYGGLACKIRAHLDLPLKPSTSGKPVNAHCLFDDVGRNGEGEWMLRIHPEVIEGARIAGIID